MNLQHQFTKTLVAGALLAASAASQAYVVTLAPSGAPLGCTTPNSVASIDCSTFQTDSVQGKLGSELKITNYENPTLGGSLLAAYTEVGQIAITTFSLNSVSVKSTIAPVLGFEMWATFNLSGVGAWGIDVPTGDTVFTAGTASLTNSAIWGSFGAAGAAVKLADLGLLPGNLSAVANATAKNTNLSASFEILPVAGANGAGGVFLVPAIWNVNLLANNVGFGPGTGTVSPDPLVDGSPVFFTTNDYATTPVRQGGSGSFNAAFVVPEPGMLSLIGVALLGLGFAGNRKAGRKA